jgi:predicted nucleic acid-binding protein
METVYIETSIISHATASPSSLIETAAMQQQAREWWANERSKFDLVTSQLVIAEAAGGDAAAAANRLKLLDGIPLLPITDDARDLADSILSASLMPQKAAADALHVAIAAVAGVNPNYSSTVEC